MRACATEEARGLFLDEAPAETIARLHRNQPERKVTVEVASVDEALVRARAGAGGCSSKFAPDAVAARGTALAAEGFH